MENVKIRDDWKESLEVNVDDERKDTSSKDETSSLLSENETHSDDDEEHNEPSETFVHGFTEFRSIHRMQDKIIEVAPAQEHQPIRIFKDKYAEKMNFLTLFFGKPCDEDIIQRFSYQKIA